MYADTQTDLFDQVVVGLAPLVPPPLVRRFGQPYAAGNSLADALQMVATLVEADVLATLDIVGEGVSDENEAATPVCGRSMLCGSYELGRTANVIRREPLELKPGETLVITSDTGSDERVVDAVVRAAFACGAKLLVVWTASPLGVGKAADAELARKLGK